MFVLVTQLCVTLCDSVDCSLPGSSVYRILQARILEWVTIPFSRGFSRPRYQNPGLLHCRQIQFPGDQGSPMVWGNSLNSTLLEKAWQSKHSISLKKKKKIYRGDFLEGLSLCPKEEGTWRQYLQKPRRGHPDSLSLYHLILETMILLFQPHRCLLWSLPDVDHLYCFVEGKYIFVRE